MSDKYFGIYCPQCNEWIRKEDGSLLFYPAKVIAEAEMAQRLFWHSGSALVVQFGSERRVDPDTTSETITLCSVIADRRRQETYRANMFRGFREDRAF